MGLKHSLFVLVRCAVGIGILYALFLRVPLFEVIAAMASAQVGPVIVALMISLLVHVVAGYRLKLFTGRQGISLSTFQAFELNCAAVFYGLFLPGGNLTGAVIRFYRLCGQERKMAEAFASLAIDRVTATVAVCLVGILFWIVDRPPDSWYVGLGMVAVLGGLISPVILWPRGKLRSGLRKCLDRMTRVSAFAKAHNLFLALDRFRDVSAWVLAFILALSVASQLLGAFALHLLAVSVGIDLSLVRITWVRSAVVLITMVPISVSGLGVREGAFLFLLRRYGIGSEKALGLSLLVFAAGVLLIGILGGVLEGRRFFRPV